VKKERAGRDAEAAAKGLRLELLPMTDTDDAQAASVKFKPNLDEAERNRRLQRATLKTGSIFNSNEKILTLDDQPGNGSYNSNSMLNAQITAIKRGIDTSILIPLENHIPSSLSASTTSSNSNNNDDTLTKSHLRGALASHFSAASSSSMVAPLSSTVSSITTSTTSNPTNTHKRSHASLRVTSSSLPTSKAPITIVKKSPSSLSTQSSTTDDEQSHSRKKKSSKRSKQSTNELSLINRSTNDSIPNTGGNSNGALGLLSGYDSD
jgi:hypothetical protein